MADLLSRATAESSRSQHFPEDLQLMFEENANQNESSESKLDREVAKGALSYRQPLDIGRRQLFISCNQRPTYSNGKAL